MTLSAQVRITVNYQYLFWRENNPWNASKNRGKNGRKRAKVAVARKLAVLLHHLWKTGEVYDPFHLAKKRGELVPA